MIRKNNKNIWKKPKKEEETRQEGRKRVPVKVKPKKIKGLIPKKKKGKKQGNIS